MEPQLPHTHGRHYDEKEMQTGQHTVHDDHNEDEHHGEKKSVFRKFKDRAKRFKNTITNHGQSHEIQHDDDEEEDESAEDPEVFGSPNAIVAQPRDNSERPSEIAEHRDAKPVASHSPPLTVPAGDYGTNLSGQSGLGGSEVDPEKWKSKIGQPSGMEEEVPFAPSPTIAPIPVTEHTDGTNAFDTFENCGLDESHGGLESKTGESTGKMKVPHDPSELGLGSGVDPANYETKVSNPTHIGGKEGLSQEHSFDNMGIHASGTEQEKFDPEHPEKLPCDNLLGNPSAQSSSYTENIPSVATTLSGFGSGSDPAKYKTEVTSPTHTGGKEAGLSEEQQSFDKMGIHDSSKQEMFDPEHPENIPRDSCDTLAGDRSAQNSSDKEKISSIGTAQSGLGLDSGFDSANYETKDTNATETGDKEAGLSQLQHSSDKMGIHDSRSEWEKFDTEHSQKLPCDTLAGNLSSQNSSDNEKISSIGTAQSGLGLDSGFDSANYETKDTNATETGGKEAGHSEMQHSSDIMGIHDSRPEWEKFDTEHSQKLPCDTLAGNLSSQSSSDKEKMSSIATGQSGLASGSDPANYETKVTKPTHTEGKKSGLSQVHHLFDKMGIHDSASEQKFDPNNPVSLPRDTLPGNQTTQSNSDKEKVSSIDTAQSGLGSDPANYDTIITNPTLTGGREAELSQVQHSFDTKGIHDSGSKQKRFDPEHHENLPRDTLPGNQSTPSNFYTEKISSIGGKEAGLSQMQHSSDKMGIHNSGSEREKFDAEHTDKLPRDTLAGNLSTQSSSDKEKILSIATAQSGLGSGSGLVSEHETNVTNPTHTGGKEAGLSQMQHSSDKVGIHDSVPERKRFDPEHPDNLPRDYLARNQPTQSSSYSEKISSMASAFSEQAVVAKDAIVSKLGYSGEHPTTDSDKEVRSPLGTDGQQQRSSNVSANKNVMERLSDAAGSWFGGKGDAPQGAIRTSHVTDQGLSSDPTGDEKK